MNGGGLPEIDNGNVCMYMCVHNMDVCRAGLTYIIPGAHHLVWI